MKKTYIFKMAICAVMAALSLALDLYLSVNVTKNIEITFYPLVLLFMSMTFGAQYGLLTGFIHAVVEQLTSPYGISVSSIFWGLAPIVWGGLSGVINLLLKDKWIFKKKKYIILLYFIIVFVTAVIANVSNTVALAVDDYVNTKDIAIVYSAFITRVLTGERYVPLLIMLPINTGLSYIICERMKLYIYGSQNVKKENKNL